MRLSNETEQRLRAELHQLITDRLPEIREAIYEARTQGDMSQNPDFFNVAEEERLLLDRVAQIEAVLARHDATPTDRTPSGAVEPGCVVTLDFGDGAEDLYFGSIEEAVGMDVVTPTSPIGVAIAGAAPGARITLATGATVVVVAVAPM